MGYVVVFLVGAAAGGAAVWFFKAKAVKLAKQAQAEAEELFDKAKKEVDKLKKEKGE